MAGRPVAAAFHGELDVCVRRNQTPMEGNPVYIPEPTSVGQLRRHLGIRYGILRQQHVELRAQANPADAIDVPAKMGILGLAGQLSHHPLGSCTRSPVDPVGEGLARTDRQAINGEVTCLFEKGFLVEIESCRYLDGIEKIEYPGHVRRPVTVALGVSAVFGSPRRIHPGHKRHHILEPMPRFGYLVEEGDGELAQKAHHAPRVTRIRHGFKGQILQHAVGFLTAPPSARPYNVPFGFGHGVIQPAVGPGQKIDHAHGDLRSTTVGGGALGIHGCQMQEQSLTLTGVGLFLGQHIQEGEFLKNLKEGNDGIELTAPNVNVQAPGFVSTARLFGQFDAHQCSQTTLG